jgi:hypothetical protein
MRVTIEHREQRSGFLGESHDYYVDCTVQFSEEEKAIIRARGLQTHFITLDPPVRPPRLYDYMSAGLMMALAPTAFIIGFLMGITSIFRGGRLGELGAILVIGAPIMWLAGYMMDRKINYFWRTSKQRIAIRTMQTSKFTVHSPDPAYSEMVEHDIREALSNLKDRIMRSAEIKPRETFEL